MSDLWTVGGEVADDAGPARRASDLSPAAKAAVEEVLATPPGLPFEFMGEVFHLRPVVDYQWELLVFADAAVDGPDAELLASNAATLRLIRAALVDGEWSRFSTLASRKRAQTVRDLMPVVHVIHFRPIARPTVPPSDSSAGRPVTPASSGGELSSLVIAREEAAGRPDRAQVVEMAAEARAAGRSGT